MTARREVRWAPRARPLLPIAVAALDAHVGALVRRALALPDDALARLSGVGSASIVVLLGDEDALPWADGVVYLGRDPDAPSLLLPTTLAPDVPVWLFARAAEQRLGAGGRAPLAVFPREGRAASVAAARPVSREQLAALVAP